MDSTDPIIYLTENQFTALLNPSEDGRPTELSLLKSNSNHSLLLAVVFPPFRRRRALSPLPPLPVIRGDVTLSPSLAHPFASYRTPFFASHAFETSSQSETLTTYHLTRPAGRIYRVMGKQNHAQANEIESFLTRTAEPYVNHLPIHAASL